MDGMLSQDEINALLSGLTDTAEPEPIVDDTTSALNNALYLSDEEKTLYYNSRNLICLPKN